MFQFSKIRRSKFVVLVVFLVIFARAARAMANGEVRQSIDHDEDDMNSSDVPPTSPELEMDNSEIVDENEDIAAVDPNFICINCKIFGKR